jgi:PTS system nitrogen regulatory IIA component
MKLDINDIARCLDLPVSTLDRWIRQGRIPVQKSGANWSFDAQLLKKWAASRNLPFTLPGDTRELVEDEPAPETLLSAMRRGGLHTGLAGTEVEDILAAVAGCVPGFDAPEQAALCTTLIERESLTSTGMGNGVAIPHPRTPLTTALEKPMIVTCYPRAPLDFNAIDARPVFVLFLLLSTSVKIHLHLLSRLAFCIRDSEFVSFLKSTPSADRLFSKISELENRLEKSEIL